MSGFSSKQNVVVIGAGIIGVCVARELQAKGFDVLLLEKGAVGSGCSYANAGWVTPCFAMPLPQPGMLWKSARWLLDSASPLYIKPSLDPALINWLIKFALSMRQDKMLQSISALTAISNYSLSFYSELAHRSPASLGFKRDGLLMVSATDEGLTYANNEMRLMAQHGIDGKALNSSEVIEFEPMLKPIVRGGVFFPNEAQIEPLVATTLLAEEFEKIGGKVRTHTEVFDFSISAAGRIEEVVTTQGRFRPDLVVMAGGSWSPTIGKRLGIRIPLLGGKGYSMSIEGATRKPSRPIMIVDRKIAVTPRLNSIRLAGTLELVNQDFSISPSRVEAIHKGAQEFLHLEPTIEPKDLWRGLRPCTPDGVPLIGFSSKLKNLVYCTGHQMLGLQSAPGSARLTAELIAGNQNVFTDPKPFSPARYE